MTEIRIGHLARGRRGGVKVDSAEGVLRMPIMNFAPITQHKIGVIQILLFVVVFEVVTGDFLAALFFIVLTVAAYMGKSHFAGDFSLAQLYGLFTSKEKPTS